VLGERMKKEGLTEEQHQYVEELNEKIKEFNEVSGRLVEGYMDGREEEFSIEEFDMGLNGKLMMIARDNTVIAHKLANDYRLS